MMKKRLAIIMAAAMITGVSATTAFAEGPSMEGAPQMGGPQVPGGNAPQGEAPTDNGQQASQMNGQQKCQNGRPEERGNGHHGKDSKGSQGGFVPFEDYVKDGTISQETYDAITKYMDENKPELPNGERSDNASEDEKPAEGGKSEMEEGEGPDLLKDLLEANVITQEEYDALAAKREASRPSAKTDTDEENTSETAETDKDA